MQTKQEIKEIVFNGGGARGAGMPGVYRALHDTQLWDPVETLAGTSVGSLTAAFFSMSPTVDELQKELFDQNTLELLQISHINIPLKMSLEPLERFLNNYLVKHALDYLEQHQKDFPTPQRARKHQKKPHEVDQALASLYQRLKTQQDAQLTFEDLYWLHRKYPQKFKNIIVTSTSADKKQRKRFHLYDYRRTPQRAIAKACAASCAIPLVFSPVKIDDVEHLDGGCEDALPSEYFAQNSALHQQQRLLFVFSSGPDDMWKKNLHGRPTPTIIFCDSAPNPLEKEDPFDIYLWIDKETKKVHYETTIMSFWNKPIEIKDSISFTELGLSPLVQSLDETQFKPYQYRFATLLAKRGHSHSIMGRYSPLWLLDYLASSLKALLGFPMYIATIMEGVSQRVRHGYLFNTIPLHSPIAATQFAKGELVKRTLAAGYYLDTMNHLSLYHQAAPEHESFYIPIVENYMHLYQTYLHATGRQFDSHFKQCQQHAAHPRFLYEFIKETSEKNPDSSSTFILTRAVEYYLRQKNKHELLLEINKKSKKNHEKIFHLFSNKAYYPQHKINLPLYQQTSDPSSGSYELK